MLWRQGARDKQKGEKKAKSWITTFCLENFLAWKKNPTHLHSSFVKVMHVYAWGYVSILPESDSLCVSVVNIYHILSDWVKLCWNSPTLIYACVHRCLNFHMKVICWQASEVLNRITDTSQTTAFVSARQKGMWMCVLEYLHSVSDRLTEWQPSLVVSQNM